MAILRSITIFLLLLIVLFACKKNEEPASINVIIDDTIFIPASVVDDFPNEIGYKWMYRVFNSEYEFADTMYVEVTHDTIIGESQLLNIWNYSTLIEDSFFRCVESNDTMGIYYRSGENYMPGWAYIYIKLPLIVGDSAGFKANSFHEYRVLEYDTIILQNGDIYPSYKILNKFVFPQDSFWDTLWFVNKVGIVKYKHHSMYGDGNIQELVSYDFNFEGE